MKHDIFDILSSDLTFAQRAWRVAFIAAGFAVVALDVLYWRA